MADVSRLPGPNADFWDWQLQGACRGEDPRLFFHPEGERGGAKEAREREAKAATLRAASGGWVWSTDEPMPALPPAAVGMGRGCSSGATAASGWTR